MTETIRKKIKTVAPYLLAAAVALLLAFVGWNYYEQQAPQRVFAAYFNPVPLTDFGSNRAAVQNEQQDELRSQAQDYHLSGNYAYALTAWRALLENGEASEDYRLYLYAASAALATGKDDLAAYYLNQLPPQAGGEFGEEVNWYRALLALKIEGPERAAELLSAFENSPPVNPVIREQLPGFRSALERLQD